MDIFFVHFSLSQKSLGKKYQIISKDQIFSLKISKKYKNKTKMYIIFLFKNNIP